MKQRRVKYIALLSLLIGLGLIGNASYIHAKAVLAKYLLRSSWQETMQKGDGKSPATPVIKPWPWADTWPVARMMVPGHDIDLIILEGDSGSVLAFGPGHMARSPLPGQAGNSVISGHRDTSFRFLEELRAGDRIVVQGRDGEMLPFKVIATRIIDQGTTAIDMQSDIPMLTLVTCYPFDAVLPGGSQRYLVYAEYDQQGAANAEGLRRLGKR